MKITWKDKEITNDYAQIIIGTTVIMTFITLPIFTIIGIYQTIKYLIF
jgi:hypothetical protein